MLTPNSELLLRAKIEAEHAAQMFSLMPLAKLNSGGHGDWRASGRGASLDFEEYRYYIPGDDPRHLDWRAYARTDRLMMKSFQKEVSPRIEIVLDLSASMCLTERKLSRTFELVYLLIALGRDVGASIRCYSLSSAGVQAQELEALAIGQLQFNAAAESQAAPIVELLHTVALRASAIRFFISDLLYSNDPESILSALGRDNAASVVLAPYLDEEQRPTWQGPVEFVDCESRTQRKQQVTAEMMARYYSAYDRHFENWHVSAQRAHTALVRVSADSSLQGALEGEAVLRGVLAL